MHQFTSKRKTTRIGLKSSKRSIRAGIARNNCAENASRPHRFRLAADGDELQLNHATAGNVLHLVVRPALQVVEEATHPSSTVFLKC